VERTRHLGAARLVEEREGQALVEFAMVLPMLLLLVLGLFEFARAWNVQQVMTDAAREAARRGVVATTPAPDSASVISTVNDVLRRAALDPSKSTIEVSTQGGFPGGRGTPMTVAISYPYEFVYVGRLLEWATGQSQITLRTSAVMRKE
jgi:Flp pilus assembly protein TadG